MRIDLYLKQCGLLKQRSIAKRACEGGIVRLNGQRVKPGKEVTVGQHIEMNLPHHLLEVEITELPGKNVSKSERERFYRVLRDEPKERL